MKTDWLYGIFAFLITFSIISGIVLPIFIKRYDEEIAISTNKTLTAIGDGFESTDELGWELLDNNTVIHAWNRFDSYYFNNTNGVQFSNHYEEYWTHNVMMIGYYDGDNWNKIYSVDELSDFNRIFDGATNDYISLTLYKNLSYGPYDFRLALTYYLGIDDYNLTVTPYIKNIGSLDINQVLGFGWKIKDIKIANTYENDYIRYEYDGNNSNDTIFNLHNSSLNFTNTSLYRTKFNLDNRNNNVSNQTLYLEWNKSLEGNYLLQVKAVDGQYNAPVTLFIKIGTLNINQSKKTDLYWYDADVTWGTPNGFATGATSSVYFSDIVSLNSTHFAISFTQPGIGEPGRLIIGKYTDGVGTSYGTAVTFDADVFVGTYSWNSVTRISDNKVVVCFQDDSLGDDGLACATTLTGTAIDGFGTVVEFSGNGDAEYISSCDIGNDKFVVFYNDEQADDATGCVGTVSGTDITFGDENDVDDTFDYYPVYTDVEKLEDDKFIAFWLSKTDLVDYFLTAIGTVSGTTITWGSMHIVYDASARTPYACSVLPFDDEYVAFIFSDYSSPTSTLSYKVGKISDTNISFGTLNTIHNKLGAGYRSVESTRIDSSHGVLIYDNPYDSLNGYSLYVTLDRGNKELVVGDEAEFEDGDVFPDYGCIDVCNLNNTNDVIAVYTDKDDNNDGKTNNGTVVTNSAPTFSGEAPSNQSTEISIGPWCYVIVNDTNDDDRLTVDFYENSTGSFVWAGQNTSVVPGTNVSFNYSNADTGGTKYWWRVYCSDGVENVSDTYEFTTAEGEIEKSNKTVQYGWFSFSNVTTFNEYQYGWFSFANVTSNKTTHYGWFNFANTTSNKSVQYGWFDFANDTSFSQTHYGWFSFSNTTSYQSVQHGWFSFSNIPENQTVQYGWFNFSNTTIFNEIENGWFSFSNVTLNQTVNYGWFSFSNVPVFSSIQHGWFSFLNTSSNKSVEFGWFNFVNQSSITTVQHGWFSFANTTITHELQHGWFSFKNNDTRCWWNTNWDYRREISINHSYVDEPLTDFTVLVRITDTDLISQCDDGDSIRFVSTDCYTVFNHEFETTESDELEIWVRIPETIPSDTNYTFFMYYNNSDASMTHNPPGTWNDGYVSVYHLNQPSGTVIDSTYTNNGTNSGCSYNAFENSFVGTGMLKSGNGAYVSIGKDASLNITENLTIEGWIYVMNSNSGYAWIASKSDEHEWGMSISDYGTTPKLRLYRNSTGRNGTLTYIKNGYVDFIATTSSSSNVTLYNNESIIASLPPLNGSVNVLNQDARLFTKGGGYSYEAQFGLDEIRISNVNRSDAWMKATYYSIADYVYHDASVFISIGNEIYRDDIPYIHFRQNGWFSFNNATSINTVEYGWFNFSNVVTNTTVQYGWFSFSNVTSNVTVDYGWFSFSNVTLTSTVQHGWFDFSNVTSFKSTQYGWFEFSNTTTNNTVEYGWFSFSNTSAISMVQYGWFSFNNTTANNIVQYGWFNFSAPSIQFSTIEHGWFSFNNTTSYHTTNYGWFSFSNTSFNNTVQYGWFNFNNSLSNITVEYGWFSFQNTSINNTIEYGWFSFLNQSSNNTIQYGWFNFSNTSTQEWSTNQFGWFSFSNISSYNEYQHGWFSFSNVTQNRTVQYGWFSFAHVSSNNTVDYGWFSFANSTDYITVQYGWFDFLNLTPPLLQISLIFPENGTTDYCPCNDYFAMQVSGIRTEDFNITLNISDDNITFETLDTYVYTQNGIYYFSSCANILKYNQTYYWYGHSDTNDTTSPTYVFTTALTPDDCNITSTGTSTPTGYSSEPIGILALMLALFCFVLIRRRKRRKRGDRK